jgi:hypothetical protein
MAAGYTYTLFLSLSLSLSAYTEVYIDSQAGRFGSTKLTKNWITNRGTSRKDEQNSITAQVPPEQFTRVLLRHRIKDGFKN